MQPSLNKDKLTGVTYLVGDEETLVSMPGVRPKQRFDEETVAFLDRLAKNLLADRRSREYPDVVTLAFWMRKASLTEIGRQLYEAPGAAYVGRGMAFHIAPSNVPANYMYSLLTGLLTGNANVVKIPSKDFPQVDIINDSVAAALEAMPQMKPYVVLVRYGHEQEINDALSEYADARVIWGGDGTIFEVQKSKLPARAVEVAFADRYSLALIDADAYLAKEDKAAVANDFFNDTYLTDQNACTSPRVVAWTGEKIDEAKREFWTNLHQLLETKYELQPVQAVNKLTSGYLLAAEHADVRKEDMEDNLIVRMAVNHLSDDLMELRDSCGYFFEYTFSSLEELQEICDNTHCQTVSYLGSPEEFAGIARMGVKGVDRIVPMGTTMDFEFLWDGYDLAEMLTRVVRVK